MKKTIIIIAAISVVIGGIYLIRGGAEKPKYDIFEAKKADIIQEVSVTGQVKPAESVNLTFEKSGRIARVYVKEVGEKVKTGQLLVGLDNRDIAAQLAQAEASTDNAKAQLLQYQAALLNQEAKLAELKRGTREEEIKVREVEVENAKTSLEQAKKNYLNYLNETFTKCDDAIRNKTDQIFTSPRSTSPQINFLLSDAQLKIDMEWERPKIGNALTGWKTSIDSLSTTSDLNATSVEAKKNLEQIKSFVDKVGLAVNTGETSNNVSQTTLDTWQTDIYTARTNVNTAATNLSTAEEKLKTAQSTLNLEENELALKKAGSTAEEIAAQEALVKQAEANVAAQEAKIKEAEANMLKIRADLAKTVILSPISGIVTKIDAKAGETATAGAALVSVISEAKYEIETKIPEADIAKVKIGDTARITLDAYGNEIIFNAKVTAIDPAETIVEGVSTYKTTMLFDKDDERIRSGMTANIDILTAKKEGVIAIPRRAVSEKNGNKIVRRLNVEQIDEINVKTGLVGADGNIEVLEGINEGDQIIISLKEK